MAVDDTVDDGSVGLWLWWWQLQAKLNGTVADAAVVWFLAFGCACAAVLVDRRAVRVLVTP